MSELDELEDVTEVKLSTDFGGKYRVTCSECGKLTIPRRADVRAGYLFGRGWWAVKRDHALAFAHLHNLRVHQGNAELVR